MVLKNHSKRITIVNTLLVNVLCADGIPHEDQRERSVNVLQQYESMITLLICANAHTIRGTAK